MDAFGHLGQGTNNRHSRAQINAPFQLEVQKSRTRIPSSCTFAAGEKQTLPCSLMSHLPGPWPALMQEQELRLMGTRLPN